MRDLATVGLPCSIDARSTTRLQDDWYVPRQHLCISLALSLSLSASYTLVFPGAGKPDAYCKWSVTQDGFIKKADGAIYGPLDASDSAKTRGVTVFDPRTVLPGGVWPTTVRSSHNMPCLSLSLSLSLRVSLCLALHVYVLSAHTLAAA